MRHVYLLAFLEARRVDGILSRSSYKLRQSPERSTRDRMVEKAHDGEGVQVGSLRRDAEWMQGSRFESLSPH